MTVDYYYLLGIPPDAGPREIRKAYRLMAEVYHPDKMRILPDTVRSEGEEIMRLLNEAKSVLLDPAKRLRYDQNMGFMEEAIILGEMGQQVRYRPKRRGQEKEALGKMGRVLSQMRQTFKRDEEFTAKIINVQEVVKADIIDEGIPPGEEGLEAEEETEEVKMTLRFTKVKEPGPKREVTIMDRNPYKPKVKGGENIWTREFKILAIEGDEGDVQEIDWEEE